MVLPCGNALGKGHKGSNRTQKTAERARARAEQSDNTENTARERERERTAEGSRGQQVGGAWGPVRGGGGGCYLDSRMTEAHALLPTGASGGTGVGCSQEVRCGTHLCPRQGGHVHDDVSPQVFASIRHTVRQHQPALRIRVVNLYSPGRGTDPAQVHSSNGASKDLPLVLGSPVPAVSLSPGLRDSSLGGTTGGRQGGVLPHLWLGPC